MVLHHSRGICRLSIAFLGLTFLFLRPVTTYAIPAFARQNGTSCSTCHIDFPKLNDFGKAFKDAGFKFPKDDASMLKIPPVMLGAPANKELWPKTIWPGTIPGIPPIRLRYNNYLQFTSGSRSNFNSLQRQLKFNPSLLVIQEGTTVDFQNDDSVQHNIFWPSVGGNKKEGHNLGTWPKGEKRSFKFDQPGVVPLLCNVHPEMAGYIIVSPTPYFAQTDSGGNFKIENVPDGKYTLVAWREGGKPQSKPVTVAGNATTNVNF